MTSVGIALFLLRDAYKSMRLQPGQCAGSHSRPGHPVPNNTVKHVIFDIGNVLIDWNPRHLYAKLVANDVERERLLAEVLPMSWHGELDMGKSFAQGVRERVALFPEHEILIRAWDARWPEMITGPIEESVAILGELMQAKVPVYAITNYNREKFDGERRRFAFYDWFDDLVVSGDVQLLKPDERIYRMLLERNGIDPSSAIFIDDRLENVVGAQAVGLAGHHFKTGEGLRLDLRARGLPV